MGLERSRWYRWRPGHLHGRNTSRVDVASLGKLVLGTPWRMGAMDYLGALDSSGFGRAAAPRTFGPDPVGPRIAEGMRRHGVAALEEALLDDLLIDIAQIA